MRKIAGLLCLSASLLAAPAFAQASGDKAASGSLADSRPAAALNGAAPAPVGNNWVDRLTVNRSAERPVLPLAPIETDQLALSLKPGGNWSLTLGLTSREPNEFLPREELKAGAYFQVNPNFRLGGGVTLNGESLRSAAEGWKDSRFSRDAEAGVRIESAFAF